MNSDEIEALKNGGITVRQYCSLEVKNGVGCTGEAVGEVTTVMENGNPLNLPICQIHLDMIQSEFDVEHLSIEN